MRLFPHSQFDARESVAPRQRDNTAQTFLSAFYVFERINNFIYGLFDLTGVVYYLSVIFLFVFFSVQNLDKRRWL